MTEQNTTENTQDQAQIDLDAQVQELVNKIGKSLEGNRADICIMALINLLAGAIKGPFFSDEQRKAGALMFLNVASNLTVDVGVSDTEIQSAMVQAAFFNQTKTEE